MGFFCSCKLHPSVIYQSFSLQGVAGGLTLADVQVMGQTSPFRHRKGVHRKLKRGGILLTLINLCAKSQHQTCFLTLGTGKNIFPALRNGCDHGRHI